MVSKGSVVVIDPTVVLIWTCVGVFAATAVITLLALVGVLTLGGGLGEDRGDKHNYYLNLLFTALLLEIVAIGVAFFTDYIGLQKENKDLVSMVNSPSTTENLSAQSENSSSSNLNPQAPSETQPEAEQRIIADNIYVTSDGPREGTLTVEVPSGWEYVRNSVSITTQNEDARLDPVTLVRNEAGEVIGVSVHAIAGDQRLFGPRNWLGAELSVVVKTKTEDIQ